MTTIVSRLEQIVKHAVKRSPIIPVKIEQGILVGNVIIESCGSLKNLWQYDQLLYKDINLNAAAIRIANNLVKQGRIIKNDEIYSADQEYGRWLIDSQILYKQHKSLQLKKQYNRADIAWARYCESRDRCTEAKKRVERLSIL
jgi:hypothetical protein